MRKNKKFKIHIAILSMIILLEILLIVGGYIVRYQYEREIGGYMSNAVDMVAPEGMLEQIQLAKQGMVDAELKEEDYGALIFKKPSNSMKFQYQHIDAIIERIEAVIDWKEKVYGNESINVETLGDVYEQKMTNLRRYIQGAEGGETFVVGERSDWIAKDTWYIKNRLFWYIIWIFHIILILSIIGIFILIWYNLFNDKYDKEEGNFDKEEGDSYY